MSWDVLAFKLNGASQLPVEQMRHGDCAPLGPAAEVRRQISELLPDIAWSAILGRFTDEKCSIEFNLLPANPVENIMLHVWGGGDALSVIVRFARPLGLSVIDCGTLQYIDLDKPSQAGWKGFQALRDKVIRSNQKID